MSGIASFAQERIFLDEQIRFSNKIGIYNEVTILQVVQGRLSIDRLEQALRFILAKHKIFHTRVIFNNEENILEQQITDETLMFTFSVEQTFSDENELQNMIYQTIINPNLFDLSIGRVLHCQILREKKIVNEDNDRNFMIHSDVLIIAAHHAALDRSSFQILSHELSQVYNNQHYIISSQNEELLQYIDYSVHERLIDMTSAYDFWQSELDGYNLDHRLSLPVDRHLASNDQRYGLAFATQIFFEDDLTRAFINYSSRHGLTLFQLGLTTFYTFLFKLTHGESDLCIACLNANRYRTELQTMIGMFVTTLPYRMQIHSQWSFDDVVKYVREKSLSILEHSHYPLQHILNDTHINLPFLQVGFDLISISSNIDQLSFDTTTLKEVSLSQSSLVAKFDLMCTFVYNPLDDNGSLSCHFVCSRDVYDETTVTKISQRFKYLLQQLFSSDSYKLDSSICKLSLILSEESQEIQATVFRRLPNINCEGIPSLMKM